MKRPFWMHQLVEYVIGVLLLSQGLQSVEPAVPTVLGAAVLANAAIVKGPLAAFPRVPRAVHRVIDVVLLAVTVAAACLPGSLVDTSARAILVGVAAVFGFVVWRTDYRDKPIGRLRRAADAASAARAERAERRAPPSETVASPPGETPRARSIDSEELGRKAGRTAGSLYNAARRRKRS